MNLSSHTAPVGVIQRVSFDAYDSEAWGEHGEGYFDFDSHWNLVTYDAEFRVCEGLGINVVIVDYAREYAQTH